MFTELLCLLQRLLCASNSAAQKRHSSSAGRMHGLMGKKDKQLTDYIIPVSHFINVIMEAKLMENRIIEADLKMRISSMSFF